MRVSCPRPGTRYPPYYIVDSFNEYRSLISTQSSTGVQPASYPRVIEPNHSIEIESLFLFTVHGEKGYTKVGSFKSGAGRAS